MDSLSISATSGIRSRMESLDLLANNLANASTSGFKADREFYSLYVSPEALDPLTNQPTTAPVIERHWTDFSQGLLTTTGNAFDFAISGRGFFSVRTPQGVAYTRNGNFRPTPDGRLITSEGHELLGKDGKALRIDPEKSIEVSGDGVILQDGQPASQMAVVDFAELPALGKEGATYFRLNGNPVRPAEPAKGATISQGALEAANFNPAEAAVRLVNVMRQFEMLQRALSLGADMNRKAIDEVAKV
jgi:flagellar basal-body rod protein FlgF